MKINRIYEYEKVEVTNTVESAIDKMNKARYKILFVLDSDNKFIGTLTDGDIRRYLQRGNIDLKENLEKLYYHEPQYIYENAMPQKIEKLIAFNVNFLPVLNQNSEIIYILHFDINFQEKTAIKNKVVIMAGGKGTRLLPLTRVIPKPLVPYNDKTIVEKIMEQFINSGFEHFFLTVNYKKEMLKNYFIELDYHVSFIEENNGFLGTAGGLGLIDQSDFSQPFFVSNCDILLDADYREILEVHKKQHSDITIIASLEEHYISYGVVESEENGDFKNILEKPNMNYLVNTGIYLFSPNILSLIQKDKKQDMPDLLLLAKKKGMKIKVFAVPKRMKDIGQWEYYKKSLMVQN